MTRPLLALALAGCAGPDIVPTIDIRSPADASVLAGYATIGAVFAVEDDRNDPVLVEYQVDDREIVEVEGDNCARGCRVTTPIPTVELDDGEHTITARVTDVRGNESEWTEPVPFTVFDIPYVTSLAVLDSQESGLNGPDIEVEVHILHDETAEWLGCAAMEEVQQDDVLYEGLSVPFLANEAGDLVAFRDIGFEVVRFVVIESDNNEHCPIWPALTDTLESDVDDLYGISPPIDLSLLFSGPIQPSVPNTTGLGIDRGRPFGR
ncbi:MAG: hypothetical protein H6737_28245 [Alphaproteobacteria bacterium]|nr:hypothetical protein [Alphaproteobacteria bacterium]